FRRVYRRIQSSVDRLVGGVGIVGLGAVHAFLPCPLLYPAFIYAFARGDPIGGFVWLAALGIGTIPSLFVYATVLESVSRRRRAQVHRLVGVAFLVLGYVPLSHGLILLGFDVPHLGIPTPVT
ncbi:MAG: sulfite exporter TauE/SafE family protein, partial [Halobacteria archaeon]|nr:sulfite exporter TauE/SafE family protein [Halobacteria archaeon]